MQDGIRVMIYAGDLDLICNWLGNRRWVDSLQWDGSADWAATTDKVGTGWGTSLVVP
jgi:carboxypeptidase C (cathepsin A)